MDRLKGTFLVAMVTLSLASLIVATIDLAHHAHALSRVGMLLASGTPLAVLAWLLLAQPARTSRALPAVVLASALGFALALTALGTSGPALAPVTWAATGTASTLAYVFWYSRLPAPGPALVVGRPLPSFVLTEADGTPVPSEAIVAAGPALLMFYRGNWCPLCMAQVREVALAYQGLAARGVAVVLVSPQPASHTAALARRFAVPMRFLVDKDLQAAKALGLAHPGGLPPGLQVLGYDGDTVLPTVVLTDATGVVRWRETTDNYRVRPEPATFLAALDAAGVTARADVPGPRA